MKSILMLLALSICLVSCEKKPASIQGDAANVPNGIRVYLKKSNESGVQTNIDTAIVMNEKFDFGIQPLLDIQEQRILSLDGSSGIFLFVSENEPIEIEIKKDSLYLSKVAGGKENETFTLYRNLRIRQEEDAVAFRISQQKLFEEGKQEEVEKANKEWEKSLTYYNENLESLIINYPESITAAIALEYLYITKAVDDAKARELYNKIDTSLHNSIVMINIDTKLKAIENVAIGKKAPYFEGKNPEGGIHKLPEVQGKVTLIDFWASWCVPCRVENPNVVDAYNQYHDKGFNIISVSLDRPEDKDKWIAAIQEDQMDWFHISRLQHWNDPIARSYSVQAIPATFLLDENGVIIDKNLRGRALHNKLSELLD